MNSGPDNVEVDYETGDLWLGCHPLFWAIVDIEGKLGLAHRSQVTLRKHAHAINRDFLALKIENFQLKIFDIFNILAQNIHCGYTLELPRRGGSNEYPQCMFWIKNNKNRYAPANPSFSI